jgi:hypothetical protein
VDLGAPARAVQADDAVELAELVDVPVEGVRGHAAHLDPPDG